MRGTMLYAPGDIRVEERAKPTIQAPGDAIVRISAACVCGSDLWPYRGIEPIEGPVPMGHEYAGVVEKADSHVRTIKIGDFVVGSFMASDNTCPICQAGYQSRCVHVQYVGAGGAGRVPAGAARGRHAGRNPRPAGGGPDPEPAGCL
jgi:threonine dehydrogenase-like Zn-dependent dehydrogenase